MTNLAAGAASPVQDSFTDSLFRDGVRHLRAGTVDRAVICFARVLAVQPDHVNSLINMGAIRCRSGRVEEGIEFLERAYALAPSDERLRQDLTRACLLYAQACRNAGRQDKEIAPLRRALALEPENLGARINLTDALSRTGTAAELSDFAPHLDPAELGCHILIACMPKSGSTFLKEVLNALTGWTELPLVGAYVQNEQELYLPNIVSAGRLNTITQQHLRATDPNIQIIQAFGIRPIVLVRNLFDIVLSLSDFCDDGAIRNTFFRGRWETLEDSRKYDLVIDHVMPWYLAFYVSWEDAIADARVDALRISYEEFIADKPAILHRVSEHLALGKTLAECRAAVARGGENRTRTRFNKGVAGRGVERLTDCQKDRLRALASAYNDVNFSLVGL